MSKAPKIKLHVLFPNLMSDYSSLLAESVKGEQSWMMTGHEDADYIFFNGTKNQLTDEILREKQLLEKKIYFADSYLDRSHMMRILKDEGVLE